MEKNVHTEEELVEKVQSGEFTMLDYVLHHEDRSAEYEQWCIDNNQQQTESSAEDFLDYSAKLMEEFMNE